MTRPNILLITVDQMRGDCLGVDGNPIVETPHLDMLAHKGVRFSKAYTATPSCIPARAALFTGKTQATHGRVAYQDGVPWEYEHMLAEEFSSAGYHTQCIGKMHVYPTRNLCGFHNVELHDGFLHCVRDRNNSALASSEACDDYLPWLRERAGANADLTDSGLDCNSWVARPWPYPEQLHPTNWVAERSIDFLRRRDPTKPFFMMSSFVRPHSPLDPPQAYFEQYIHQEFPPVPVGDWAERDDPDWDGLDASCSSGVINPSALHRARAAYYALITHIDHQIGRLLQALFEYGVYDNTIILFTSDHGDLLGDHNLFRKSAPFEGSSRVPFLLCDPANLLGVKRGTECRELAELRDVMPTLLECAGVPIPDCVEGKSLLSAARGEPIAEREYLHGEHLAGNRSYHMIATQSRKYVWYSQTGRELYFDLDTDPQELHDLSASPAVREEMVRCRGWLMHELSGREEGYTDGERLIAGRPARACLRSVYPNLE